VPLPSYGAPNCSTKEVSELLLDSELILTPWGLPPNSETESGKFSSEREARPVF
jgi:hypothetical protein